MRSSPGDLDLIDLKCIAMKNRQSVREFASKVLKCDKTANIALDRNDTRTRIEQGPGQSARTRADFVDCLAFKGPWNCSNSRKKLPIENEILTQSLACAEAMARDDFAQRLGPVVQGVSDLKAALCAAILIAAAIGRGSATSCPAMSKAVP